LVDITGLNSEEDSDDAVERSLEPLNQTKTGFISNNSIFVNHEQKENQELSKDK